VRKTKGRKNNKNSDQLHGDIEALGNVKNNKSKEEELHLDF
jgi:hypothetical protein